MRNIPFCLFLFCFGNVLTAQHQPVFPGLSGNELLENLADTYKSNIPFDYSDARDTLFGVVYNQNDSLRCVYSGYKIWIDPSEDPTMDAFDKGINTEHTYPQSLFGVDENGRADMHHLYPTREDVNGDRGNFPFGEIPDNETQSWYYLSQETSSIPSNNIDLYSERKDGLFEPPEAHKGNVARAMMYFYTMYKTEADQADPTFFEAQRETLCEWHFLDPADPAEWSRTWIIAQYQDGKPNPFVLDCTLPERSYCQDFGQNCTPNATHEEEGPVKFSIDDIIPNPARESALFHYTMEEKGEVMLELFSIDGSRLDAVMFGHQVEGSHAYLWENKTGISDSFVICRFTFTVGGQQWVVSKKLMVK